MPSIAESLVDQSQELVTTQKSFTWKSKYLNHHLLAHTQDHTTGSWIGEKIVRTRNPFHDMK